jgi:hypothetical protein
MASDILKLDTYVNSAVVFVASNILVVMNYIHHFLEREGYELEQEIKPVQKSTYINDMKYARVELELHMARIIDLEPTHPQASHLIYLLENIQDEDLHPYDFSVQLYDNDNKRVGVEQYRTPWELFAVASLLICDQLRECVEDEDEIIGKGTLGNIKEWFNILGKCLRKTPHISNSNRDLINETIRAFHRVETTHIHNNRGREFPQFSPGALLISIVMYIDYKFAKYISDKVCEQNDEDQENETTHAAKLRCDALRRISSIKYRWEEDAGTMLSSVLGYDQFYDVQLSPTGMNPIPFPYIQNLPVCFLTSTCTGHRGAYCLSPFQIHHYTLGRVINSAMQYNLHCTFQHADARREDSHTIQWIEGYYAEMETKLDDSQKASSNRKKQRTFAAKQQKEKNKEYRSNWEPSFDVLVCVLGPRVSTLLPNPKKPRSMLGFQNYTNNMMAN